MDNYLTTEEIARKLKIKTNSCVAKLFKKGIKRAKKVNGQSLFLESKLYLLQDVEQRNFPFKQEPPNKYYPLKTTETYHIYESKMNYEKN
jgi:hypothetical protein